MPKVTWHGKGGDPLPSIEVRGVTFPLGEAVDVEDHELLDLLASNPHFEVEEDPAQAGADEQEDDDDDDGGEDKPLRAAARRHVVSRVQQHIATRKKK